jgi:hypothetical protein
MTKSAIKKKNKALIISTIQKNTEECHNQEQFPNT